MSKWAKNDWKWLGERIVEACLNEINIRNKQAFYFAGDEQKNYFENKILSKLIATFAPQTIQMHWTNSDKFYERTLCISSLPRERFLLRDFSKAEYFRYDFFPFCYWYKSELVELAKTFCDQKFIEQYVREENIHLDTGQSFSYKELEWAFKENDSASIIGSLKQPQIYERWYNYTSSQQKLLAKLWALDKETRWKAQTPRLLDLNLNR